MDKIKAVALEDWLFIMALSALVYFTYRSITPFSPQDFGIGVSAIFGGKGVHAKMTEGQP